jgi:3-phosphoshikimate 1-carboxyvinyltransferase
MKAAIVKSEVVGEVKAPSSKSSMQRAVAAALLAPGETRIINPSSCDDCRSALAMAECLGARIKQTNEEILITGGYKPTCSTLDCGESGLGVRMFSALAALHSEKIRLTGSGSIMNRPMSMLEEALPSLGASVILNKGRLPADITGPMTGGTVYIDGSLSSQLLTGLLITLPVIENDSTVIVNNLKSKPYIDLTIDVMQKFGIEIHNEDYTRFIIPGRQEYVPTDYRVEGDWSGAAFPLVLGAIHGYVRLNGISQLSTQADRVILDALRLAGAEVTAARDHVEISCTDLVSFEFNITDCPDLAPPLVALAANCKGTTIISGIERLRAKESDRAATLLSEFSKIGVDISVYGESMHVKGSEDLRFATVDSHGDHRIAMALAVAGTKSAFGLVIEGADAINKSYPGFFEDLKKLGGKVTIS